MLARTPGDTPLRARVPGICWIVVAAYATYLLLEVNIAADWAADEILGNLLTVLVLIFPSAGLAWIVGLTSGIVRATACATLLLSTAAVAAVSFYALHLAPPDGQNALIIPVAAFGQFILLLLIAAIAIIARFLGRRQ